MSLGAGLGGFVDGLEAGMRMRERYDANKEKREQKAAAKQINADTKAAFAEARAAGAVEEGDYEAFWKNYALPKMRMQYLEAGEWDKADQITKWGESEAALKGGKLFSSAMWKAQSGDAGGALKDAIAAGQTQGYIDHGYTLVGQDELRDKDGNLRGYRVTVKDSDGNEHKQDIKPEDLPQVIANVMNPVAAGQSQIAARQKAAEAAQKTKNDLALHEGKKVIDEKYKKTTTPEEQAKLYSTTRDNLVKNDPDFADLTEQEQDKKIRSEIDRAKAYGNEAAGVTGTAKRPAPTRMIVDTKDGKVVPATGITQPVSPDQVKTAVPIAKTASDQQTKPVELSAGDRVADANLQLKDGANPEYVKQQLLNNGVPEDQWPDDLKKRTSGFGAVGLGL